MNTFKHFWLSMPVPQRRVFASACGTSYAYLNNFAHGQKKRIGENLCINIERESGGKVVCEQLRPDVDWAVLRRSAEEGGDA
ncbi:YdaS family helix-turn-helix protein [Advenella sp. FME57]|uniref:YdaS family helix-turn-helix protein n=1 Tax=Advenella sp. FME57 TaxID=2742604 RepID=UPI0018674FCD|nr:YdaS family helix-turn-helix protein [Advenella sp. FME57]